MDEDRLRAYVIAAAAAQGLAPGDEAMARIVAEFVRVAAVAKPVLDLELPPQVEPVSSIPP